jgi:hypothetical protein
MHTVEEDDCPERGRCQCRIGRTPVHALTDLDDSDKDEDYVHHPATFTTVISEST